jgi:antitoxin component of RelBE/YafQ-DinJ toxin-antitoxin module
MRYVVLPLLSMWLLPADAQTKPILQKQLLNMAQQSEQIQVAQKNDATEALKSMATDISQLHTQTLNQIVQLQGWPTKAQVTEEGVRAAFSLASHSNNLSFQQNMLPFIIQSYMDKQGMSGEAVAIFTDKVSIAQGKNQVFGTQADLIDGKLVFFKIENEDSVDQLRAQMGMTNLAEYKKILVAIHGLQ